VGYGRLTLTTYPIGEIPICVPYLKRACWSPPFSLQAYSAEAAPTDPTFDDLISQGKYCSATAQAAFRACGNQTLDDYWIAVGICTNEKEAADRKVCLKMRATLDRRTMRSAANNVWRATTLAPR
jgi:hypothetical protein